MAAAAVVPILALFGVGIGASMLQMLLGEWESKQMGETYMKEMLRMYAMMMPLMMMMQMMQVMPMMLMRW